MQYAVWLYNRIFHRAIDGTPFEAWTGRKPTVDNVMTFGAKLTSKTPGDRNFALDPHHYDGIFLGYTGTMSKLKYWDVNNHNEKTAHHEMEDELHYSANPSTRPPAARHLLEVFTGTPHHERSMHQLLEQRQMIQSTELDTTDPTDRLIEDSPPSYTMPTPVQINKVKLHQPDHDLIENIRSLDVTLNLCKPAISEKIPLHDSQHPLCGLDVQQHIEYEDTVYLRRIIPGTTASNTIRNWKS